MRNKMTVLVGVALLTLGLSACGEESGGVSDGVGGLRASDVAFEWLDLPDGGVVLCALRTNGGIDCDW